MRVLILAGLGLVLIGCGGGGTIKTKMDEVTGSRTDRMTDNRIGPLPCNLTGDPCVFLEAERIVVGNAPPRYRLAVIYEGTEWLFIQGGRTLEFTLKDTGQSFSLFGQGSKENRKILKNKKLRETATYEITPNNLLRLAESSDIRMKVHGDGFFLERGFTTGNRENLKAFAHKFLGN